MYYKQKLKYVYFLFNTLVVVGFNLFDLYNTQALKNRELNWYSNRFAFYIKYNLNGVNTDKFGQISFVMSDIAPHVFKQLFGQKIGQKYGKYYFILIKKKTKDGSKYTSRSKGGFIPIQFLTQEFNNGASFETKDAQKITKDIYKCNLTYTLPMGNLNFTATIKHKMPGSSNWQYL